MNEFIHTNLKYPKEAVENRIEGKVRIKLIMLKKFECNSLLLDFKLSYFMEKLAIGIVNRLPLVELDLSDTK